MLYYISRSNILSCGLSSSCFFFLLLPLHPSPPRPYFLSPFLSLTRFSPTVHFLHVLRSVPLYPQQTASSFWSPFLPFSSISPAGSFSFPYSSLTQSIFFLFGAQFFLSLPYKMPSLPILIAFFTQFFSHKTRASQEPTHLSLVPLQIRLPSQQ